MERSDYKRILVIKMSSLGDIIHALPTLYAIRQNWPNAHITWAVHEQFSSILPSLPWIDEVIYVHKKKLKSISYLKELRRILQAHKFDISIDLQCIAKSAIVAFLSGAKEKYGYWELREGSWLINRPLEGSHKYDHVIERYLDTVRALGGVVENVEFPLPHDEASEKHIESILKMEGMTLEDEYIVIAPGARWIVKEWPLAHWAKLIDLLCKEHKKVILIGSEEDASKGKEIEELMSHYERVQEDHRGKMCINLIGKTSLQELIELLRHARLFISADTGPLHMANALKVDLVALFGVTSPQRTGPYGGDHVHIIESPTSRATVKEPLVNDPQCMSQISVDLVYETVQQVLGNPVCKSTLCAEKGVTP